jgi:hypothetical protein
MTDFRMKLAIILIKSELNDDDVRNRLEVEETNIDPTDCMIVPTPPKKTKFSNPASKVEFITPSLVLLPSVTPTNVGSTESPEVESLSECLVLSPFVKPTNDDLIDELCLYISMIDDVPSLE